MDFSMSVPPCKKSNIPVNCFVMMGSRTDCGIPDLFETSSAAVLLVLSTTSWPKSRSFLWTKDLAICWKIAALPLLCFLFRLMEGVKREPVFFLVTEGGRKFRRVLREVFGVFRLGGAIYNQHRIFFFYCFIASLDSEKATPRTVSSEITSPRRMMRRPSMMFL